MDKVKSIIGDVKRYWREPPAGRYMTYKEILSLSFGGMGQKFIYYVISQMIITIGNALIGNTIGIDPSAMYVIYIISVLSGFPLTALRAAMIDNTRSMKGKYRPYLVRMGIPTVLLGIGFISMPYERMSLLWKSVSVLGYNIGFQFFFNFYTDAYDSLINVLSPNSIERSDVLSIRSVIENFSPSVANIFLPIVARWITGENTLYNLKVYRVLFPPMLFVGFAVSMLAYVNTEEKIVQAKTHVIQIKFIDAFRAIAKNKYFWIISLAGWLGFLESSFNSILGWLYNYQGAATAGQYAVITAIAGNASFWPNLVAPFFIRKYGKKKVLVFTNVMNIGFIALMLPIVRSTGKSYTIWLLLACMFVNQFITSLGHLLGPSIQADIRDYQQYISGERIDGMFAAVGLIGNAITLATSSVLPALYERAGLNRAVAASFGYTNVYDVLFHRDYFVRISSVLVFASVAGAALNVIPFFFYDLTENDQRGIVSVLKIRAMFEDYGNGVLKDENLIETVDIIENAKRFNGEEPRTLSRDEIKRAEKSGDSAAAEKAKEAYRQAREENIYIATSGRILDELAKFSTEQGRASAELAERIVAAGKDGFLSIELPVKKAAKAMPKNTERERENRRDTLTLIENMKAAKKAVKKYYPNGLEPFDSEVFEKLFEAQDDNEAQIAEAIKELKAARESGDKGAAEIKAKIASLRQTRREIAAELKKATNQNSIYYRAAKPYLDAERLLKQRKNYENLEEITALYEEAKARKEQAVDD